MIGRIKKYRAWDIRNAKMVYDALVLTETGQLVTVNAEHFNSPFSFFDGCIWMEITGVDDNNGRMAYESDIVKTDIGIGRIIFSRGCFMIEWLDDPQANIEPLGFEIKFGRRREFEILGNGYENPGLLPTGFVDQLIY